MVLRSNNIRLLCACTLLAAASALLADSACASIIVPDADVVDIEALIADLDKPESSTGTSSGTTPSKQPIESPSDREDGQHLVIAFSPTGNSTSNTSTSPGGSSGANSMAIHSSITATSPDLDLVGWTNGEARFALPTPPGNDLLRPPQDSCTA